MSITGARMNDERIDIIMERVLSRWPRMFLVGIAMHVTVLVCALAPKMMFTLEAVLMAILTIHTATEIYESDVGLDSNITSMLYLVLSGACSMFYISAAEHFSRI